MSRKLTHSYIMSMKVITKHYVASVNKRLHAYYLQYLLDLENHSILRNISFKLYLYLLAETPPSKKYIERNLPIFEEYLKEITLDI